MVWEAAFICRATVETITYGRGRTLDSLANKRKGIACRLPYPEPLFIAPLTCASISASRSRRSSASAAIFSAANRFCRDGRAVEL